MYFRLKITDEYYYPIGVNEGIDCDFDAAETERKGLFSTVKVYGDKYIIVNTLENTAEIFDDEDALSDYMDSLNKSIKWIDTE
ncbi:MAG: hypothetical protein LUG85_07020 [Clostridiales bacterium]|nr:hypothetical protein [Clostridiales bacterium]